MGSFTSIDDLISGCTIEEENPATKNTKNNQVNQDKQKQKPNKTSKQNNGNNSANKKINKKTNNNNKAVIENYDDKRLVLGVSDNKKDTNIFIPERSRYLNTLVIGSKGTGKTECLLPKMIEQDLKNTKVGMTIITTKKEMAYNIYALAKFYKRKESEIVFLKPSVNNVVSNKLLWCTEYSYDFINEYVIDYKEAIKKKKIVIIDMETLKYKSEGLRAVAMLLLQLELDMQETDITQRTPHMLYIDDGQQYIPFLKDIVNNSDSYNLAITMFIQSRNQLLINDTDYTKIIDNDFRNILLLNNINIDDSIFYKNRFEEYSFYNREFTSILYEILDNSNRRRSGIVQYSPIEKEFWGEIEKSSKKCRTKLLNVKRKHREEELKNALKNKSKKEDFEKDPYYNFGKEENEEKPVSKNKVDTNYIVDISKEDDLEEKSDSKQVSHLDNNDETHKDVIEEVEIKDIIKIEEKTTKRKLSQEIFNKLNKNIEICSKDFLFSFDD